MLGSCAGWVGTAVLAASDRLETALLGHQPLYIPHALMHRMAQSRGVALGPASARSLGAAFRWSYGTTWGALFGALRPTGARWLPSALALSLSIYAFELATAPRVGATPRARRWPRAELSTLLLHTTVYGLATEFTYRALSAMLGGRSR